MAQTVDAVLATAALERERRGTGRVRGGLRVEYRGREHEGVESGRDGE